jgi:hypothetical protein
MSPRTAILISLVFALLAGAGLAALVNYTKPSSLGILLASPLVVVMVGGLSMPLWLLAQRRLTPKLPARLLVRTAWREGLWSGLYAALLAGLRVFGYLDWVMVLVLAALFIMLELFLQQRQQPQPAPKKASPAPRPAPSASFGRTKAAPKRKRRQEDDGTE